MRTPLLAAARAAGLVSSLGLGIGASPVWSQSASAQAPELALQASRTAVQQALRELDVATSSEKEACAAAGAADIALLEKGSALSAETTRLAVEAKFQQDRCVAARDELEHARHRLELRRHALRAAAGAPGGVPQASVSPAWPAPTLSQLQDNLKAAEKAQEAVETLRGKLAGLYDTVDTTTAQAINLEVAVGKLALDRVQNLQSQARRARNEIAAAQRYATEWVDLALTMKPCAVAAAKPNPTDCLQQQSQNYWHAVEVQELLRLALRSAESARADIYGASRYMTAAEAYPEEPERLKAADFAKLLEDYPDARAAFARDGFQLLAGTNALASVQFGIDSVFPAGVRRVTLKASVPLSGSDNTDVFGSADGLANGRKFSIAWNMVGWRGGTNVLYAISTEVGFGSKDFSYYEDNRTAFTAGKQSRTVYPWELAATVALHVPGTKNAHVLRASGQRAFEPGPTKTRCPDGQASDVGFVECIVGPFGAPAAQRALLMSYQYRFQVDKFGLAPSLSYNTRSEVVSLAVPLYKFNSADDAKVLLNGGLRFEWNSKGKESITGNTRSTWAWGVFVGAPFKLFY